jgi:hypothetical protein
VRRPLALLGLLLTAIPVGPARSDTLTNPGFATDLSGWTVSGDASWSNLDADDSLLSGSVLVGAIGSATQCLPVTGAALHASAAIRVDPGQSPLAGIPGIGLTFSTQPGCAPGFVLPGRFSILGPLSTQSWEHIGGPVAVPNGAASVTFELLIFNALGSTDPFFARFDDVSLVPEPRIGALAAVFAFAVAVARRSRGHRGRVRG